MAGGMLTDSQLERIIGSLSLMDDEFFGPFFSGSRECLELMLRIIQSGTSVRVIEPEPFCRKLVSMLESILRMYR